MAAFLPDFFQQIGINSNHKVNQDQTDAINGFGKVISEHSTELKELGWDVDKMQSHIKSIVAHDIDQDKNIVNNANNIAAIDHNVDRNTANISTLIQHGHQVDATLSEHKEDLTEIQQAVFPHSFTVDTMG